MAYAGTSHFVVSNVTHFVCTFRLLAHAKLESVKSKEEAEQRWFKKKSWLPFTWWVGNF